MPAGEIEGVVIEQLRGALRSPEVLPQVVHEVTLALPDISETEAIRHLQSIDEVWDHLFPAEQARIAILASTPRSEDGRPVSYIRIYLVQALALSARDCQALQAS